MASGDPGDPIMLRQDDVTEASERIANALHALGTGNSSTNMGAMEYLAVCIKDGLAEVASAIRDHANAIREK